MNASDGRNIKQHILETARTIIASKGYSAVGLNELLLAAEVPKGSFYHYFGSKDAFGVALLEHYFSDYLANMQLLFERRDLAESAKLLGYWQGWRDHQGANATCLAVKLGAEVADLSEPMRQALQRGTGAIIERLAGAIAKGCAEGSLQRCADPQALAEQLYALWLGASVMAKITRDDRPLGQALAMTRRLLGGDATASP